MQRKICKVLLQQDAHTEWHIKYLTFYMFQKSIFLTKILQITNILKHISMANCSQCTGVNTIPILFSSPRGRLGIY